MKRFFQTVALYLFHIGFARPVLRWVVGVRYRRLSNVPEGACLVVSNHNSHLDAAVLMGMFPLKRLPQVHPVAAADYFGSTMFKQAVAMSFMNGIPIQRRPKPGTDPLQPLMDQLNNGHSLVFFPEGSRGEAGVVARFRPGIGKLVKKLPGLLVVPVYLAGPERIWPRGQTVPVPLNIDAIIGKPRSYNPEDDARVIAEKVQRDVLALAPPPPPPPGETERPPTTVAICGTDGPLRGEWVRRLTEKLRAVGISDSVIVCDDDGPRELSRPAAQIPYRAWAGILARLLGAGSRLRGKKFTEMIESARVAQSITERQETDYLVTDGSAVVDLAAWALADGYGDLSDDASMSRVIRYLTGEGKIPFGKWWSFLRKAPEVWLVNELSLVRPSIPEFLVLCSPPIPERMRRLRERGAAHSRHQTEEAQQKLFDGYRRVADLLRRRHGVELIVLDDLEGADEAERLEQLAERVRAARNPSAKSAS